MWQTIQVTRYLKRYRSAFGNSRSEYLHPAKDRAEYLQTIRNEGIKFHESL